MPNMDVLRKHLLREGHLNKPELMEIVQHGVEIMSKYQLIKCSNEEGAKTNRKKRK